MPQVHGLRAALHGHRLAGFHLSLAGFHLRLNRPLNRPVAEDELIAALKLENANHPCKAAGRASQIKRSGLTVRLASREAIDAVVSDERTCKAEGRASQIKRRCKTKGRASQHQAKRADG